MAKALEAAGARLDPGSRGLHDEAGEMNMWAPDVQPIAPEKRRRA